MNYNILKNAIIGIFDGKYTHYYTEDEKREVAGKIAFTKNSLFIEGWPVKRLCDAQENSVLHLSERDYWHSVFRRSETFVEETDRVYGSDYFLFDFGVRDYEEDAVVELIVRCRGIARFLDSLKNGTES